MGCLMIKAWKAINICGYVASFCLLMSLMSNSQVYGRSIAAPVSAKLVGHADPRQILDLRLVLIPSHQRELAQFLSETNDPKSSQYQLQLDPAQFNERFGVTKETITQVSEYLNSQGFTQQQGSSYGQILHAKAPVAVVERVFSVKINNYTKDHGKFFFAADAAVKMPPELVGKVSNVRGIDNMAQAKTRDN